MDRTGTTSRLNEFRWLRNETRHKARRGKPQYIERGNKNGKEQDYRNVENLRIGRRLQDRLGYGL